MIPKAMQTFLTDSLTQKTWEKRLIRDGSLCYLEFTAFDVETLSNLGIKADWLGPHLVSCMWDEKGEIEIGGFLVVDNLMMGKPSMGGIRMLPTVTPAVIHNLARGMTLKNAAATLPFGGGKAGIIARPDLASSEREEVIRGFARLISRYRDIYNPGPDVGTSDSDMRTIAVQNGLDVTLSKPIEMGGTCIDLFGGAAGGVVTALRTVLQEFAKMKKLPQFRDLIVPSWDQLTVLIQGFGAVGANVAHLIMEQPGPRIVGISDKDGYLYCEAGLPVDTLFASWKREKLAVMPFVRGNGLLASSDGSTIFSNDCNRLLRESAFFFIPAAPVANYMDFDRIKKPSILLSEIGTWSAIIEGANTYSPDPESKARRLRIERVAYREKGILMVQDYLVNSGGVIFAAQERLIPTPKHLQIPREFLGDGDKVESWLNRHREEFAQLSQRRSHAGREMRDAVIAGNIVELVDLLCADINMLPCEAAEKISVNRIQNREKERTIGEIMEPIATIPDNSSIGEAAQALVESNSDIVCVVSAGGTICGVVTDWDITRAAAQKLAATTSIASIISRVVVSIGVQDHIVDAIKSLEYYRISSLPVVEDGRVVGVIGSDILARSTLLNLLKSE